MKDIGLSKEDFLKLPEKVQERLAEERNDNSPSLEYENLNKKYTDLTNDVVSLKKDPVIAARLEEKRTGKSMLRQKCLQ